MVHVYSENCWSLLKWIIKRLWESVYGPTTSKCQSTSEHWPKYFVPFTREQVSFKFNQCFTYLPGLFIICSIVHLVWYLYCIVGSFDHWDIHNIHQSQCLSSHDTNYFVHYIKICFAICNLILVFQLHKKLSFIIIINC